IPFRVVCLLGMNDGDYPRAQQPLDFDLMASDYRPGDRSRREDDRYLLLEALLSARDQLYVSWVGRSIRDNSERPASVLIGQLRDHVAAGWRLAGTDAGPGLGPDERLLHALTQEHPLQPFSPRYFQKGSPLFSFAHEWQVLHLPGQAVAQPVPDLPPFIDDEALSLTQLHDFLRHPVRHFFSQRLKVFFEALEAPTPDEEPFVLDTLQRYGAAESLLNAALADPDHAEPALQAQARRLQACGLLPLAGFGQLLQAELIQPLPDLLQRHRQLLQRWPHLVEGALPVHFEQGRHRLEGWLGRVYQAEDQSLLSITTVPNTISAGRNNYKWHRLIAPWVMHLAACAAGYPLNSALVASDLTLLLAPLPQGEAAQLLGDLLVARQAAMNAPLSVAAKTAFAWLGQDDADKALAAAARAYEGDERNSFGERSESIALARQFRDFAALSADETFEGWCETLYRPLFNAPWQALGNPESGA
ncbi:MAG: exodeoxyribonuclease V subunit gamma, partial [Pseudomonas capeferrum]